jgi:REP element-mobilizing transposase RayT
MIIHQGDNPPCRRERGTGVSPVNVQNSTSVSPANLQSDAHVSFLQEYAQDAHATVTKRQGAYLPHWTREGATYTVTFRLADYLPQSVLEQFLFDREDIVKTAKAMNRPLNKAEEKRLADLHSEKIESYLDAGHGSCWLRHDPAAKVVAEALLHFDGERYRLAAWCVMPNHVHAAVTPLLAYELSDILHSWKSFTSKEANKLLGRDGQFWQVEYFDHLIRGDEDFVHALEYVLGNPSKAGLKNWKWVGLGKSSGTRVPPIDSVPD